MKNRLHPVIAIAALVLIVCYPTSVAHGDQSYSETAQSIRNTFECTLHTLDPDIQRHYAARIFRTTGDTSLIYPILFDLSLSLDQLRTDLDSLADSGYLDRRAMKLFTPFTRQTRKAQLRGDVIGRWRHELIYLNILTQTNKLTEYRLDSSRFGTLIDRARRIVIEHDYARFLLDTAVIRVFAPQAVNYVFYLQALGGTDLRGPYQDLVRQVYPDSQDSKLDEDEFGDKVYALTHVILAASRYYQEYVDSTEYGWITDYFVSQFKRVLKSATPDMIAEVGLCFCLTGQEERPEVAACRDALIKAYDKRAGMIPSVLGRTDLAQGEHRNVLAVMLLSWTKKLHAGPRLTRYSAYRAIFEPPAIDNAD